MLMVSGIPCIGSPWVTVVGLYDWGNAGYQRHQLHNDICGKVPTFSGSLAGPAAKFIIFFVAIVIWNYLVEKCLKESVSLICVWYVRRLAILDSLFSYLPVAVLNLASEQLMNEWGRVWEKIY